MRAGKLDRRIRIERAIAGKNSLSEQVSTWSLLADAWATVAPAPGRERFQSGEKASEATTVFTIRWQRTLADLSPKDRVRYPIQGGAGVPAELYDIHAVVELGRREGFEITATRRGDQR